MGNIINLNVVINTDGLKQKFQNPSQDQNNPTGISHEDAYMFVLDHRAISDQGTGNLNFAAKVGDRLRINGTSEHDNFEQSILIYKIDKFSGVNVFDMFKYSIITQPTPQPGPNVLPPKIVNRDYWFYETNIINPGVEGYRIWFALYVESKLYGYFYWDPTVTVFP